eukprot:2708083-Prymnesium_polylepis.1
MHFDVVKQLTDMCATKGARAWADANSQDSIERWSSSFDTVDLPFVMTVAIKFADLGHATKSNAQHLQWTQRVTA